GRRREVDVREVMNGVMYVLSTGCQWRAIPKDLPHKSTVFAYLDLWSYDGTLERIHYELYVRCREQAEREASPTAAIVDSQSVKSAEKGGLDRPEWLRCGKEDQGQEAAYSCRYAWPAAAGHRSSGRYPGSRRRHPPPIDAVRTVPFSEKALRRWRLLRAAISEGPCPGAASAQGRNRQTLRSGQGLRKSQAKRADFRQTRLHPVHAQKTL